MLACDNPQIQSTPPQEFAFDAAVTGLAFLAEGTLADGAGRRIGAAHRAR